jgi:hypothetical protein
LIKSSIKNKQLLEYFYPPHHPLNAHHNNKNSTSTNSFFLPLGVNYNQLRNQKKEQEEQPTINYQFYNNQINKYFK